MEIAYTLIDQLPQTSLPKVCTCITAVRGVLDLKVSGKYI